LAPGEVCKLLGGGATEGFSRRDARSLANLLDVACKPIRLDELAIVPTVTWALAPGPTSARPSSV
jgi:hypothetical protein